jgi:hypothetical protein
MNVAISPIDLDGHHDQHEIHDHDHDQGTRMLGLVGIE